MASSVSLHVQEDFDSESRRRLRHMWLLSGVVHLALLSLLWLSPDPPPLDLPRSITVSLLAAPPAPPAPTPAAKPASRPAPKPVPQPVPKPAPAPPPPPPAPKVKVLPKQAPPAAAKVREAPRPEPVIRRTPRPQELSYEDALAQLRGDLGESAPAPVTPVQESPVTAPSVGSATAGTRSISPELAAWHLAVKRHVRAVWITPPEFRERGLAAEVAVDVGANGSLRGSPELLRSSGNPFYDDNAVRALVKSSPLPIPPSPGRRVLIFTPEE